MNNPRTIFNSALAASAGTGKTFALSNRFLGLLASGFDPASIVALTFTRKAAGEILTRILTRLSQAAHCEDEFLILNAHLADARLPGFVDRPAVQSALRRLIHDLPRLRIGTLDSFFLQILRQFRLEAGIGAELSIAPELDAPEDNRILQNLLEQADLAIEQRRQLLETFRLATFGEEQKSTFTTITRLVQNQYELFQRVPDEDRWGAPTRIWNDGYPAPLPLPPAPDWPAVIAALAEQAGSLRPTDRNAWNKFIENLQCVQAGGDFGFDNTLDARLYTAFTGANPPPGTVPFGRGSIPLSPATRTMLAAVFAYIRSATLGRQIIRTVGLRHLLAAYDREHRRHIARTGQLSFNDIAQLLAPASKRMPDQLRMLIDCRLDARFRHWLFDEFQDTSLIQWAVIENLVDEVIQNPDADRTFFYVGDTKQAVYEWRSGDPRLFRRILDKYNHTAQPAIEVAPPLVCSWRSSPDILEAIERVFGNLPTMSVSNDERLQNDWPVISSRWAEEWTSLKAAPKNNTLSGHVALHLLPRLAPGEEGSTPITRAAELVRQLQTDIPDFDRLSVAILTRSNSDGLAMLAALAALRIHAVWAGNSPLLDNALLPAILSLVTLIEHPGNTLARRHFEMSPLAGRLSIAPDRLAEYGRQIRAEGYAGFIARLSAHLDLSNSPLERTRLRTLVTVAAEFDREPDPTALRFASFVQARDIPAEETGAHIQILTMHKAKGLEYDVVLLPALGDKGITAKVKPMLLVHEQNVPVPIPPVDWILATPESEIVDAEPPLAAQLALVRQNKALEELRLLYVAMTRAKRALYLITTAPAQSTKTLRLDNILQNTLAPDARPDSRNPVWQVGNSTWWQQAGNEKPGATACPPLEFSSLPQTPAQKPLKSRIASQEHSSGEGRVGWIFRPEGITAREFGTRIHALFEQIEWLAPGVNPVFSAALPDDAQCIAQFLQNPDYHRLFEKPEGTIELMREQAFEAILDDRWLSGKIDRLHLERNRGGKFIRACIYDFKTDQTPAPERHRSQLEDYRQAVALLFNLPLTEVACHLLYVRAGVTIEI